MTAIMFRGRRVMTVRNGVATRRAGPGEMLTKPRAWCFHLQVLQQLERAQTCHIEVADLTSGVIYRVPWETFAALSVETDRGFGKQRYLPLEYWSVNGKPPLRKPPIKQPVCEQLSLFGSGHE